MFLLLTVCCILIYGMVMVFLPKNYQVELQNQFTTDLYKLTESLEKSGWEDISQDIFLMLWGNRSSLNTINNFKSYLFRVCKNAAYRHIERALLFKNYQQKQAEKVVSTPENNETDDKIQLRELELLVAMVVEKMPPQRKKIYKMSRESGMSSDEIAQTLGINKRTVENHLSQALTDIRKVLFIAFILFSKKI